MNDEELVKEARERIVTQIDFECSEGLNAEERQNTLARAIHYQRIEQDTAETFLEEAERVVEEVRLSFANSIADQVQRAEMILSDIAGLKEADQAPPVEEIVRLINSQIPDIEAANSAVDQAAIKIGNVLAAISEQDH